MKPIFNFMMIAFMVCATSVMAGCDSDSDSNELPKIVPTTQYYCAWEGDFIEIDDKTIDMFLSLAQQKPEYPLEITLTAPGSLKTVLAKNAQNNTDALIVSGPMDRDDCRAIVAMACEHYLINLDLSEASFENNTIPQCAFSYSEKLGYNDIGGYSLPIFNLVLPAEVSSIGEEAFASVMLRSVVLPKKISEISKMCFGGNMLEAGNLVIPEGVTKLQESCFNRNPNFRNYYIDEIVLPSTLSEIGSGAFGFLKSKSIVCYAVDPPSIEDLDLYNIPQLYVPKGSRDKYAAAPVWSDFKNIIERDDL